MTTPASGPHHQQPGALNDAWAATPAPAEEVRDLSADHHGTTRQADIDPATELLMSTADDSPAAAAHTTGTHTGPPASRSGSHASAEPEERHVKAVSGPPSPPWYGGVAIGSIFLMAAILLTYTLLDWDWQQELGWWNYVATIVLIPLTSVMMRLWRPDTSTE